MLGATLVRPFDEYEDLSDVPKQRQLRESQVLEYLRKAVPFRHVAVGGLDLDGYEFGHGYSIDTDMPPAFIETYFAEGLGQVDPVVIRALKADKPYTEEQANDMVAPSRRFESLAQYFGIRNRFFIPIAREGKVYGGVCFTSSTRPFTAGETEFLIMTAAPLHRALTKPLMDRFAKKVLKLTPSEIACLELASTGLTSEEIAEVSKYKIETINSYLKSATKKLGASNRLEAVATAIRRGLLR